MRRNANSGFVFSRRGVIVPRELVLRALSDVVGCRLGYAGRMFTADERYERARARLHPAEEFCRGQEFAA